jgi:hypothetical protein
MRRPIRARQLVVAAAITALASTAAWFEHQKTELDHVSARAAGIPPYFRDAADAQIAIKEIAASSDRRSTDMLLAIALRHNSFTWPPIRDQAIRALSERNDAKVAVGLCELLRPTMGVAGRQAAADSLLKLPCNDECLDRVLDYLARIARGESNYEDTVEYPPGLENEKLAMADEQQKVYRTLDLVLVHDKSETVSILKRLYGLGTHQPSGFSLNLVARLKLTEACPALLDSGHALQGEASDPDEVRQVEAVSAALSCR